MQRPEILRVASSLSGRLTPVVFLGPSGSGKTFIAQKSVQAVGRNDSGMVAVYLSVPYRPRYEQTGGEVGEPEFVVAEPGAPLSMNWRKLTLSDPFEIDTGHEGRQKPADLWCLQVEEAFKNNYMTMVVIDDYDLIRTALPSFKVLERFKSKYGVKFLLTSSKNLFQLNGDLPGEREFLETSSIIKASLPSDEVAFDIIDESWTGETKSTLRHSLHLEESGASFILALAGNYPGLITCLIRLAVRQGNRKRSGPISRWVNSALGETAFLDYVKNLLGSLSRAEKLALSLLAIGHESGRDSAELRDLWEGRLNRNGDERWINLDISLKSLAEDRLLVRFVKKSRGDEPIIASRALASFVAHEDDTRKLARILGIPLPHRFRFRSRVFFKLWLLGLVVFIILTFVPGASQFRLLVWLPAVCYLVFFMFFKQPTEDA
jgi:hypothetical protein